MSFPTLDIFWNAQQVQSAALRAPIALSPGFISVPRNRGGHAVFDGIRGKLYSFALGPLVLAIF
jgi:hypothetical protein